MVDINHTLNIKKTSKNKIDLNMIWAYAYDETF